MISFTDFLSNFELPFVLKAKKYDPFFDLLMRGKKVEFSRRGKSALKFDGIENDGDG